MGRPYLQGSLRNVALLPGHLAILSKIGFFKKERRMLLHGQVEVSATETNKDYKGAA